MSFAAIQACNQHKFSRKFDLVQLKFVLTLDNCCNKYTKRWMQINHFTHSQLCNQTFSRVKATSWDENN